MKHINFKVFIILSITFFGFIISCKKDKYPENPTYSELEKLTRKSQDDRAVFTFAQYEELLKILSDTNFIVLPINEFKDSINDSKIMFGMRHDVDRHPFKALKMAHIESRYNIRSSYYILATAKYYGKFTDEGINRYHCLDDLYREIYNLGDEIGIHNDLLTVMIKRGLDPFQFNKDEIDYYKSLGIVVNGSVAHGSTIANETVSNYQIFSDFAESEYVTYEGKDYRIGEHSMSEYGFEYEANFVNYTKYYSDSGGNWNVGSFSDVLEQIKNAKPGDRIQMLAHPLWWGKK